VGQEHDRPVHPREAGKRPACRRRLRLIAGRSPRRLSLDLTGLPPDPAQVDVFVADTGVDAYERYVDRLLNSSRWGEHRARLLAGRGNAMETPMASHVDNYRENWVYRNWVIDAFNRNLPFDRFHD